MPSQSFRIGVANVSIPTKTGVALPDISAVTVTVASAKVDDVLIQDIRSPLDPTATYSFIVALRGYDEVNKGYTIGAGASGSNPVQVSTTGYGILLTISNSAWPAGFDGAVCADIFIKKNAGSYQHLEGAIIDPSNDFNHMVLCEPLQASTFFTQALLLSTTTSLDLGSRVPYGITFNALTPTTGGVEIERTLDVATLSPDTGPNFPVPVTRSTVIKFQLLANDIKNVIQAWAGSYSKYTTGGHNLEEAQMSLMTAQALITENAPIKLLMPINKFGKQETRLYVAGFIQNVQTWTEAWKKDAQTPVSIQYNMMPIDSLVLNCPAELVLRQNS